MNEPRNSPDDFRETHDLGPCGEPFEELGEVERQLKKVRPLHLPDRPGDDRAGRA